MARRKIFVARSMLSRSGGCPFLFVPLKHIEETGAERMTISECGKFEIDEVGGWGQCDTAGEGWQLVGDVLAVGFVQTVTLHFDVSDEGLPFFYTFSIRESLGVGMNDVADATETECSIRQTARGSITEIVGGQSVVCGINS